MQHLPRLALFAIYATNKNELINEFKNQSLDFIVNNPIGMGVQWACTMDVGIRVSNLLIAHDIFSQIDANHILDDEFKKIFSNSIYHHGQFIFNHLEYKEGLTGNHYLFNLSGLLFVSSYLNKTEETVKWLEFSLQEIEKEVAKQFFNDGGNFEGSTTYHCLSAEMMGYSAALMLRNNYNFSVEFKNRLAKIAHFILAILKPNGEAPQFGDNDSGRYFKLSYVEQNDDENLLNYEGLIAAFSGIIDDNIFSEYKNKFPIESIIIRNLANSKKIETNLNLISFSPAKSAIKILEYTKKHEISYEKIENLIKNLSFEHFPYFGISIFKSANFYLAISSISNKKMHHSWGHVHNDKLSFELFVNGKDVIQDAGSYCYTSNIEMRNKFRSTKAHHTIIVNGIEQNKFISSKNGLFYLEKETKCELLELTKNSIKLKVEYYGIIHIRKFEIFDDKIAITDYCNKPFEQNFNSQLFSRGYGKKLF
ncbi:MAG: alginate lyase family protein [Bacteroidetes bacterium]|nr:alginate lyase family protein [Bacteroidota bacterium]